MCRMMISQYFYLGKQTETFINLFKANFVVAAQNVKLFTEVILAHWGKIHYLWQNIYRINEFW